jgi:hypothetical protein
MLNYPISGPIANTVGFEKLGGALKSQKFTPENSVPLVRLGTPKDIAYTCVFLCTDAASFVSGHTLVVDGGSINWRPAIADREAIRQFGRSFEKNRRSAIAQMKQSKL